MPSDQSGGRAWRQQAGAGGGERKQQAQPQWRREPATPAAAGTSAKRVSRKTKLAATALGFLIFCGLLVWAVTLLMPPKPACVVLLYADSEENLAIPTNPYGRIAAHDLQELTESGIGSYFWNSKGSLHLRGKPTELHIEEAWDKDLGDFKEKTVVVYLGLIGGADTKGAYLLPANSNGGPDEKNRLRLEKILTDLAKIDSKKNKLLILDATQISADWPLGILHNGFARMLNELESKIEAVPNL